LWRRTQRVRSQHTTMNCRGRSTIHARVLARRTRSFCARTASGVDASTVFGRGAQISDGLSAPKGSYAHWWLGHRLSRSPYPSVTRRVAKAPTRARACLYALAGWLAQSPKNALAAVPPCRVRPLASRFGRAATVRRRSSFATPKSLSLGPRYARRRTKLCFVGPCSQLVLPCWRVARWSRRAGR
jgi:hypothetical protein